MGPAPRRVVSGRPRLSRRADAHGRSTTSSSTGAPSSRPKEAPDWKGDTGRVEAFFEGARLDDLEKRLGLPPGGFTPKNVVIYICGLTGTITGTIVPLIDRGFVPDFKRIREALGVPADDQGLRVLRAVRHRAGDQRQGSGRRRAAQGAHAGRAREAVVTAFVLGATGFVGREVVRQLCVRGTKTFAHVRPDSKQLADWRTRFGELGAEVDTTPWDAAALAARWRELKPAQVYILIGTTRSKAKSDAVAGQHLRDGRLRADEDRRRRRARLRGFAAHRLLCSRESRRCP